MVCYATIGKSTAREVDGSLHSFTSMYIQFSVTQTKHEKTRTNGTYKEMRFVEKSSLLSSVAAFDGPSVLNLRKNRNISILVLGLLQEGLPKLLSKIDLHLNAVPD